MRSQDNDVVHFERADSDHTPLLRYESSPNSRPPLLSGQRLVSDDATAATSDKPLPSVRYLWLWVALNIVAAILQYLTTPLWVGALPSLCADPFVVYQIAATMFMLLFLASVVVLQFFNGNDFFAFVRRLTWRGMMLVVLTGLFMTGNGVLVVISSPVQRTPPVITTTFPNISYILMILVIWWMHNRVWLPEPKIRGRHFATLEFVLFCVMYVLCTYTTVVATNEKAAVGGQIYWWLIFMLGMALGYAANQLQEVFFKTEDAEDDTNTLTNFLFCALLAQWIFALLSTWIDFVPGVNLTKSSDIACGYRETLSYSFKGMGLLWNVLCSFGNYLSYVASIKTNTVNTGLTMLITPISTAIVIAISYNFPALTPDKSLVDVFFFFPMILSSILMIFFYAAWYKGTRLPVDRLIDLREYLVRYEHPASHDQKAVNP